MVSLNKKSLAFILYDWATSPITTIHTTFIFSVYFVEKIAVENGYHDAFIIAFLDDKKISIYDALNHQNTKNKLK